MLTRNTSTCLSHTHNLSVTHNPKKQQSCLFHTLSVTHTSSNAQEHKDARNLSQTHAHEHNATLSNLRYPRVPETTIAVVTENFIRHIPAKNLALVACDHCGDMRLDGIDDASPVSDLAHDAACWCQKRVWPLTCEWKGYGWWKISDGICVSIYI